MSAATEPQIRCHDELSIMPAPIIPTEAIRFDREESERRGRHITVYAVTPSKGGEPYTAVYHMKSRVWYCSCPAGKAGNICKHLRSITYHNAYNAAYRAYVACDMDDLRAYDLDFARMERGKLGTYRGWEIDRDCLGDVMAERLERQAAA